MRRWCKRFSHTQHDVLGGQVLLPCSAHSCAACFKGLLVSSRTLKLDVVFESQGLRLSSLPSENERRKMCSLTPDCERREKGERVVQLLLLTIYCSHSPLHSLSPPANYTQLPLQPSGSRFSINNSTDST